MRIMVGLDRPTHGSVWVNGTTPHSHAAPLHEVGALLEARSVHPGRSARNHLLALALTSGISRSRVDQVLDLVGLVRSLTSESARSRWAWGNASEWPLRRWATRRR